MERDDLKDASEELKGASDRPALTWRTWAVSIIVAVVLSVTATLLLGGSIRLGGTDPAAGSRSGGDCCPPAGNK